MDIKDKSKQQNLNTKEEYIMAKENVGKFYDKLAQDAALAEKLNALDKEFARRMRALQMILLFVKRQ